MKQLNNKRPVIIGLWDEVSAVSSSRREFIKKSALALGGLSLLACSNTNSARGANSRLTDSDYQPGYLALEASGELERREELLWEKMESCDLCPRNCRVNRMAGRQGACSSDNTFRIASYGPHFGEEAPFVGNRGSGTIFFSNCNLLCIFCQNWEINHRGEGVTISHDRLANAMLTLQRIGCSNINVVTPTHIVPHIISALRIAIRRGLNTPLLYNTGGYDSLEVLKLLDGVVDMYLPDLKFYDNNIAFPILQNAPDYPLHAKAAIKEMHRQVGFLQRRSNGVAYRGLLIRHLVLPNNISGTDELVKWIASELGTETHVNIMGQYRPEFRAREFPPLDRRLTQAEFLQAMRWAREAGLHNFH